jgi:uncharacterized damage-inducible protein DinB
MKPLILALALAFTLNAGAETQKPTPTLKSILLDQLRSTHSKSDWFVCSNVAVANLTPEQANWTDGKGNHSVGQLTYHLAFWNQRALQNFRGEKPPKFSGNNDETFNNFDTKRWNDTVRQLDQVLTDIEKAVESANDKQLTEWAPTLANISTHNAYHIGEIVMVRKEQGAWDASKGVK